MKWKKFVNFAKLKNRLIIFSAPQKDPLCHIAEQVFIVKVVTVLDLLNMAMAGTVKINIPIRKYSRD